MKSKSEYRIHYMRRVLSAHFMSDCSAIDMPAFVEMPSEVQIPTSYAHSSSSLKQED